VLAAGRPALQARRSASPVAVRAFEGELGVQAPVGYWDPLGYSKDGNAEDFYRRRCTEIKHGRVSMWAAMGYIAPEYFRWPGECSVSQNLKFTDIPNGLKALSVVSGAGWAQIFLFCGFLDVYAASQDPSDPPGKLSGQEQGFGKSYFGSLGVYKGDGVSDPEKKKRALNAEIANGRLAMVAIIGMFFQDGLTGSAWGDWALYTDSPLRAFEGELGVQAPVGFWDPAGFCKDGDADNFYRRRCTEIKHGRVSMWAAMGYIVPEYFRWPGFVSVSSKTPFTDIPNGLKALSVVSGAGWGQIFLFCGFLDVYAASQDPSDPPGKLSGQESGFGKSYYGALGVFKGDGIADPEKKKRSLNSELANGRLAMFAIIGMFFQDGLTGSAWGDWALYTDSPLRAFESELGVQAPVGYWDPLGLSKDGDEAKFKRRRASELKHGRVCMYACLGYIVPEYFRFPGFLSVSENLKFADMPSGINGMFATPVAGGLQIFLFAGFLEVGLLRQDGSRAPGDFENCGNLGVPYAEGVPDPEARKRSLNAEIANGRLAMVAFMGMLFQNGTFGTTGPEMWLP